MLDPSVFSTHRSFVPVMNGPDMVGARLIDSSGAKDVCHGELPCSFNARRRGEGPRASFVSICSSDIFFSWCMDAVAGSECWEGGV
jgi:hypothetical protein